MSSLLAVASLAALASSAAASRVVDGPVHRPVPNSKSGRRMASSGVDFYPHNVSKEHEEWNRRVTLEKAAKKAANLQQRSGVVFTHASTHDSHIPPAPQPEPTDVAAFQTGAEAQQVIDRTPLGGSIG